MVHLRATRTGRPLVKDVKARCENCGEVASNIRLKQARVRKQKPGFQRSLAEPRRAVPYASAERIRALASFGERPAIIAIKSS